MSFAASLQACAIAYLNPVPAVELAELPEDVDDLIDRLVGRLRSRDSR
jgi:hypothetical protein